MKTLVCTTLGVYLVACGGSPEKHKLTMQEIITADPLPLAKGAKWTYDVSVKRYDPDADKETSKTQTWTTEVLDAREANGVTAYQIKGWPADLASLEAGDKAEPSSTTILRAGNSFLFGKTADPSLDGAIGWFTWPMIDGQKFCPKAETVYCWQVAAIDTGYTLTFYTGPDEQSFDLEPNTGVARFHYAHHGTTNEVEAKLVSFSKGAAAGANPPR
jgi:hypothetical protein